jgi:predicted component of type VI protein secretion system
MEESIKNTIHQHEPRAEVYEILVQESSDLNGLLVSIAFTIRHDPDPIILDLILERTR